MAQRRISLLVVLVLLALAAAAVALWPRSGARFSAGAVAGANDEHTPKPNALDRPAQPCAAGNSALPLPAGNSADVPGTQAGGTPGAPATPATEEAPGETLWEPVYGDAVRRSTARAEFALTDAQGQPLVHDDVKVGLYRRVAGCWVADEAYYDPGQRRVVCDGLSMGGLEPGDYELEITTPDYGWLRHGFTVFRGQRLEGELNLPNWRRILCVRFTDLDGNPIAWIDTPPQVAIQAGSPPAVNRETRPPIVLRNPPEPPGSGSGEAGGGTSSFRRSGSGRLTDLYATDRGCFYAAVIAGAQNTVTFPFNAELWGQASVEFAGQFLEPAEDQAAATLTLAPDFAQRTERWSRMLEDDPGQRSLLNWAELLRNPLPLDDAAGVPKNRTRVVLDLSAPAGIVPMYERLASDLRIKSPVPEKYRVPSSVMRRRDGRWYAEVFRGDNLRLAFGDGQLVLTECEIVKGGEPVVVLSRTVDAQPLAAPRWELPPTVDAWAAQRILMVTAGVPRPEQQESSDDDAADAEERVHPIEYAFDGLRGGFAPAGRLPLLLQSATAGSAHWMLAPAGRRSRYWDPALPWCRWDFPGYPVGAPLAQDMGKLKGVLAGADLKACSFGPGLAWRAVGPRGEGLPFVEACLMPHGDDALAQRLLAGEREVFRSGVVARPDDFMDASWFAKLEAAERREALPPEQRTGPDEAGELLPEAMRPFAKTTAEQVWFARNGAWYNSRSRYYTDQYGYCVTRGDVVQPGRLYVLYLWSSSRNDLQPDLRIVFRATKDLTDLGAIALPGYAD